MAISVFAHDLTATRVHDIPLRVDIKSNGAMIDTVSLEGLPETARLSAGKRDSGSGVWRIPFQDFKHTKLSFAVASNQRIPVRVEISGTDATGAVSVADTFTVYVSPDFVPATLYQKVGLAIVLVAFTAAVFICWRVLYSEAQEIVNKDSTVVWAKPANVVLRPGPPTFWYASGGENDPGVLHHRGPIDPRLKLELLNLARVVSTSETKRESGDESGNSAGEVTTEAAAVATPSERHFASYHAAIDQLTFKSNADLSRYFLYLLSIAGLSGILGTQIRAFADFIHLSARRNELDVSRWWTWYAMRPFLGFLLGLVAVLIVEAKIFVPTTDSPPSGTAWWMAIAMLVGFASDDFAQRLRLIGHALFGKDARPSESKSSRGGS